MMFADRTACVVRRLIAGTRGRRAPMSACSALILLLASVVGCDSLSKVKGENPVFPAPPPRLSLENAATRGALPSNVARSDKDNSSGDGDLKTADADESEGAAGSVRRTSGSRTGADASRQPKLDDTEVVATVNGQPIFASEVLDRYAVQLAAAKKQASPEEFRELRAMLLKRDLPGHIQQRILLQHLRGSVKAEQLKMLQSHLDSMFDDEIVRLMKASKVETRPQLEEKLAQDGTSLESLRTAFMNQRMAFEYLGSKSKFDRKIGRRELYDYYQAHEKDYSFQAQVKWQQLIVFFDRHGGKEAAYRKKVQPALAALSAGEEFPDVVRKFSDGSNKETGGVWDWMPKGSLDDEEIEQALFEMPPGSVSEVFVNKKSWQIVKVIERRKAGVKPFEELQDEIRGKLEKEARRASSQKFLDELLDKALVDSPYVDRKQALGRK